MFKQVIVDHTGEYIIYRQENPDGSWVFYTPEAPFIIDWLAEGNTPEPWNPEQENN